MKVASVVAFVFLGNAAAFMINSNSRKSFSTSLHLVPGQGNQLVAAYTAATCQKEKENNENGFDDAAIQLVTEVGEEPSSAAARSIASRIFSLPSTLINRKNSKNCQEDIVLYPLVGFKLVHYGEKVIALPTKSHVACRLPVSEKDEAVYGWYSPSCSLDLYAEDISEDPSEKSEELGTSS